MCSCKIRFLWYDKIFVVSFTVVILNAALAVLSDKGVCVCVCVLGGVKENNKQNKKFKVGWPFSVA